MNNYKNRGMLLEKIINNSIHYYNKNKIAFFQKKNLDITFKSVDKNNLKSAIISKKSTVDYYGIYQGKYICFEAKSTENDSFSIYNFKQHQHEHLKLISFLGGCAFYIFYFKYLNKFYLINIDDLEIDFNEKKSISIKEIELLGKELEILFPGILDFLNFI